MTSASEFQTRPQSPHRQTAGEPTEIVQQLDSVVRDLDTPLQKSIASEKLGQLLDQLKEELAEAEAKLANDRLYGPFLTTERTMKRLGLKNRQALTGRVDRNTILRVKTSDGRNAYPELQFDADRILPALKPVLQLLLPHVATAWTALDWLVHSQPSLRNRRPIDMLRDGETELVEAVAREDVSAWAA